MKILKSSIWLSIASLAFFGVASAVPKKPLSGSCAHWIGTYSGKISSNQSIVGGDQKLAINIGKIDVSASLRPFVNGGSPWIDIASKKIRCSKTAAYGNFYDNFDTKGKLLIYTKGRNLFIEFNEIVEGDRINNSGYYPESAVIINKQ
jgi:hypothetical protein